MPSHLKVKFYQAPEPSGLVIQLMAFNTQQYCVRKKNTLLFLFYFIFVGFSLYITRECRVAEKMKSKEKQISIYICTNILVSMYKKLLFFFFVEGKRIKLCIVTNLQILNWPKLNNKKKKSVLQFAPLYFIWKDEEKKK